MSCAQKCPDISDGWGPCVTTSKPVIHHLVLYQSCGTNALFEKNILNFSQIPEAQFNSIPLLSQFSKGASAQLVMLFQMEAATKTPQSQAPSFILQFSPCLFKHRRQKGKRIIIYNWDLTFFFVDLLSSNLNYVCISLWLFVLLQFSSELLKLQQLLNRSLMH